MKNASIQIRSAVIAIFSVACSSTLLTTVSIAGQDARLDSPVQVNIGGFKIWDNDALFGDLGLSIKYIRQKNLPPTEGVGLSEDEIFKLRLDRYTQEIVQNEHQWIASELGLKLSQNILKEIDSKVQNKILWQEKVYEAISDVIYKNVSQKEAYEQLNKQIDISRQEFTLQLRLVVMNPTGLKEMKKCMELKQNEKYERTYNSIAAPYFSNMVEEYAKNDLIHYDTQFKALSAELTNAIEQDNKPLISKLESQLQIKTTAWQFTKFKNLKIIVRDQKLYDLLATADQFKDLLVLAKTTQELEQSHANK